MTTTKAPAPGDAVCWTQIHEDGTRTERTGTVWDLAPILNGQQHRPVWVIPDEPLPTDGYAAIVVVTAGKTCRTRDAGRIPAGLMFSEDHELSRTGSVTLTAGRAAARIRERVAS